MIGDGFRLLQSGVLLAGLAAAVLSLPKPGQAAERMWERARPVQRPEGAPRAGDVIIRSLRLHPHDGQDPHDTMQALRDFHATTLAWAYITDADFIRRVRDSGRVFGGAASAPSYRGDTAREGWFEDVVIVDLEGRPIIAPWKRSWKRTLWGCVNNPELERGYLEYLKHYIDVGAQVMQRDEPGANLNATRWGGCFCGHCIEGFRRYLAANLAPAELEQLGIEDPATFDYREHLQSVDAPVGDAFGNWKGGPLKEQFIAFQTESTVAFHQRTRKALDAYAGRRVPFSCNNGARRWSEIELVFDWAFGELAYSHATAAQLYHAMQAAAEHGRIQVVTMPKKGDYNDLDQWQQRTRQTIAMAYACGGHCMVPWDVYMPRDAPRYFGRPEQYADLFGFIRASRAYLDGYESAAAWGHGVPETGNRQSTAVRVVGDERVAALVRAIPDRPDTAVVVHLVDWSEEPRPFTVQLDPAQFFGDAPLKIRLLRPTPYARDAHQLAEETGDYRALSETVTLAEGRRVSARVPALDPWGILVVEPD